MKALIHKDEESGWFMISSAEGWGGPVISGEDLEKTKKSYKEALSVAIAVRNLNYVAKFSGNKDELVRDWIQVRSADEVEFVMVN